MWLQRHHYVGRAIALQLNVLLLDSDVLLARSPYPYLKQGPLRRFHAIVLSDATASTKPLRLNGGVWYLQHASAHGPLRQLFERFDAHVNRTLGGGGGTTFDQQILNEQASVLVGSASVGMRLVLRTPRGLAPLIDMFPRLVWQWSARRQPSPSPTRPPTQTLPIRTPLPPCLPPSNHAAAARCAPTHSVTPMWPHTHNLAPHYAHPCHKTPAPFSAPPAPCTRVCT